MDYYIFSSCVCYNTYGRDINYSQSICKNMGKGAQTFTLLFVALIGIVVVLVLSGVRGGGGGSGGEPRASSTTTTLTLTSTQTPTDDDDVELTDPPDTRASSQIPISVVSETRTVLRIKSDYLTSDFGYFLFTLYRNAECTVKYVQGINTERDLYVQVHEKFLRNRGYAWSGISPPFNNATQYWLKIDMISADMTRIRHVSNVSFATDPVIDLSRPDNREKINRDLQQLRDFVIAALVGEGLAIIIKAFLNPTRTGRIGARVYDMIIEKLKKSSTLLSTLKASRVKILEKVSARFDMFMNIFRFSLDDVVRVARQLPRTLKKIAQHVLSQSAPSFDDIIASLRRPIGAQALKNAASQIGNRLLKTGSSLGRLGVNIVKSLANPVDVALLAIGITGMILDAENVDGLQNWESLQTADFLAIKEKAIEEQVEVFSKYSMSLPAINGPLLEYTNEGIDTELHQLEIELLMLPLFPLDYSYMLSRNQREAYTALSEFGYITEQSHVDYVENLQVIRDLRSLQDILVDIYRRRINDPSSTTPYSDGSDEYYFEELEVSCAELLRNTANSTKIHMISVHILCKMNGGNPLADGQCSYRTPTDCFNSYPWPPFTEMTYDEEFPEIPSSPVCSTPPCLSTDDDIGKTDFFYSEWRDIAGLQRDYPLSKFPYATPIWDDPAVINAKGACTIFPDSVRVLCESTTRFDDYGTFEVLGTNEYNKYTGECTNTKAFCDAYGVSFRPDMPVSEMAWRGSGPLPSCYMSDADLAGSYILGGNTFIQGLNKAGQIINSGLRTFAGFFTGANEREEEAARREAERIALEQDLMLEGSEEVQTIEFNQFYNMKYADSDTVQLVDFRVDPTYGTYVMYAYGTSDGTLSLMKYDNFFNPARNNSWGNGAKLFMFLGPVENQIRSKIALDSMGSLYILETNINSYGRYEQRIKKIDRVTGDYNSVWRDIRPESLIERGHVLDGRNLVFNDNGQYDSKFNGIFIRNDVLYVTFVGYDMSNNNRISLLLKYTGIVNANTELIEERVITERDDYLPRNAPERGEEVHSFIVDDAENHYSFFLNNVAGAIPPKGRGILTKYNAVSGTETRININSVYTDAVLREWPSLYIDKSNNIIICDGKTLSVLDGGTTVRSLISINNYDFYGDPILSITIRNIFPWEVCCMCVDTDNNICMINQRYNYINFGNSLRVINGYPSPVLFHAMNDDFVRRTLDKRVTARGIELGVDFIKFKGLTFGADCLGHEVFSITIQPPPQFLNPNNTNLSTPLFRLQNIRRTSSDVLYPFQAGVFIFDNINAVYFVDVYVDGVYQQGLSAGLPRNTQTFSYNIGPVIISNPTGVDPDNLSARLTDNNHFPWSDGGAYDKTITFDQPITARGTRILFINAHSSMGAPRFVIAGETYIKLSGRMNWMTVNTIELYIPVATQHNQGTGTWEYLTTGPIRFVAGAIPDNQMRRAPYICYTRRVGSEIDGYRVDDTCENENGLVDMYCPDNNDVRIHRATCEREPGAD